MKEKRTLLVVEDNELNREMLTAILEDSYKILPAENGAEGLEVLKDHGSAISLILLDIQMPVMDGYEFLNIVSVDTRYMDIPIIVTTSGDSDEEQIKCLSLGASDFVVKPYKPEIIRKRVEGLIRLREATLTLHKVEHDEATGLYNRESFSYRVERRLNAEKENSFDMVCLEIESYTDVLGRYGSEKCRVMLRNIADHVVDRLDENVIIGRIDSSRIAFLAPARSLDEHTRMVEEISRKAADSGVIPNIHINTGIYQNVDHNLSVATIVSNTISPLSAIRFQYGKMIALYDDAMRRKQDLETQLADMAETAIAEKQFKVWYQPKHNAAKDTTGGAEALIRWIHPEMGFISPGLFVPVFESNGFIVNVDLYVIESVCADLRRWMDEGKRVIPVSANISQMDFDKPDLADVLEQIVDKYNIPHDLIHFEITESANASDKEKKAAVVSQLHDKQFVIELDDFGSGYSNLTTLGELPIDVIKLDMSLVRNMHEPGHHAILRGVLYTAAALGKKVVAEGIETAEQVQSLKDLCDDRIDLYFQGYYYSKPLAADQFEIYLKEH